MTVSRRHILVVAGATAAATLCGRFARSNATVIPSEPRMPPVVGDAETLILHDGGAAGVAFARTARTSAAPGRVFEFAIAMLTMAGFAETGARLDQMQGGVLLSLLDDADTVVVEALLKARNADGLSRHRYGRQVLLSAHLPPNERGRSP